MAEQAQFSTRLQLARAGERFEVLLIQAGRTGPTRGFPHGLELPAGTLRSSLPLWDNLQSFIDHKLDGHSIRDLCGVISAPQWDEGRSGIKALFTPFGPAAEVARQLAGEVLEYPELSEQVGFSADFYFEAEGERVTSILAANSADLVIKPAAGGKWLRAISAELASRQHQQKPAANIAGTIQKENEPMNEIDSSLKADENAGELIKTSRALCTLEEANQAAQKLRLEMCKALLSTTLAGSHLPEAWQERIRRDFEGRLFEAAELDGRIEADRQLLSLTTAGTAVHGPANIHGMFSADDELAAAVDDLFGNERDETLKHISPARLTGIRELYMLLTGDRELHGCVDPHRAQFQLGTTNFTVLVKNALNKSLARQWEAFGRAGYDWWMQVATVEHFTSLNDITWSIFGTIGSLPTVSEGAEYTPLKIGDGGETSSFTKKGGYVGLTLEAIDRDDLGALKRLPKELAFAAIREISASVAALFTANSGTGPDLADGGKLFNNTAVTTAGGHKNLLTTALGTDYTAWDAVAQAMYNQPMLVANETGYTGTGKAMAIEPKFCLVPRALRGAANTLFVTWQVSYGIENTYYGQVLPLTVPEWTDATDWAAVADPKLVPGIMIGERFGLVPEVFIAGNETDPAVFMNDESRIKVRHFTAVGVADFRPLHKSNVAN